MYSFIYVYGGLDDDVLSQCHYICILKHTHSHTRCACVYVTWANKHQPKYNSANRQHTDSYV